MTTPTNPDATIETVPEQEPPGDVGQGDAATADAPAAAPSSTETPVEPGLIAQMSDPAWWRDQGEGLLRLAREELVSVDTGVQVAAIILAFLVVPFLAPRLLGAIGRAADTVKLTRPYAQVQPWLTRYIKPLLFVGWFGLANAIVTGAGLDSYFVRAAFSLSLAGFVIRVVTDFIKEPFWRKIAASIAWFFAALHIFALSDNLLSLLDSVGFTIGTGEDPFRFSLLWILRSAIIVVLTFAIAGWLSKTLRKRVETLPSLEPSLRILAAKTLQVALLVGAGIFALSASGINLSALAIFGGAIGLGIGFGLQAIFSNLVSGVILLMDRSLKPGDVIEVGDTYGEVNSLGMRYTSVVTRNGHEHLIPNERLMTEEVVNWSFSDKKVRIKRPIGIDYSEDPEEAMRLVVEAASKVERVLDSPAPKCLLKGFGESSVDLEVRFWIRDPEKGVNAVASEVLLEIWKSFREHDIGIPFKQTDVHLSVNGTIPVRVEKDG
jgi:small-conductance mechanosensitive channel